MKWAKTHLELHDENIKPSEIKVAFAEYDSISVKSTKKKGKTVKTANGVGANNKIFYQWATYDNLPPMNKPARRKYEIFCGGFLYFYDNDLLKYLKEVNNKYAGGGKGTDFLNYYKNKSFDHEIYFQWEKNKGHMSVTIFISPTAGNPDPPTPPAPPPPETSFA